MRDGMVTFLAKKTSVHLFFAPSRYRRRHSDARSMTASHKRRPAPNALEWGVDCLQSFLFQTNSFVFPVDLKPDRFFYGASLILAAHRLPFGKVKTMLRSVLAVGHHHRLTADVPDAVVRCLQ